MKSRRTRWKEILGIAWPLIIANSFWNFQITIDRVYLGNYSTEALAATMAVAGVFWAPMALLQQTASYVMTFVAQYFGAKRYEMIGPAVWQSIYLSIFGGLLFLIFIPLSDWLFEAIGHSETLRPLESEYFKSLTYSAMPTALVAAASGFFTGLGNTKVIMKINFVGLLGNAVLDYPFIFGKFGFPEMGVAGAGYATTVSTWISAIYGFYLVFNRTHELEYKTHSGWRLNFDLMKRFIKYGLPSGMQWALEGLAFTIFLIFIGRMANGEAALAGSGIAVTVMMLAILPALGVAQAVSVLVGQNLGEKNPARAEEMTWTGLQVSAMYIMTMGFTFVAFPSFYINWYYNPQNETLWLETATVAKYILMYVAIFTAFDSMNLIFSFALKGAGDTRFVTLVALLLPWPLMVAPAWYMQGWNGAVYWAWGAASVFVITQALVFLWRFRGGKWKSMSVIH